MPKFAIKRWDGEVHVVEAASLEDAGNRYGWPGNGTIEPYEAASHAEATTANFASPDEHAAFVGSDDYLSAQAAKVAKADKAAIKAVEKADPGLSEDEVKALVDAAVAKALAGSDAKGDDKGDSKADDKADSKGSK